MIGPLHWKIRMTQTCISHQSKAMLCLPVQLMAGGLLLTLLPHCSLKNLVSRQNILLMHGAPLKIANKLLRNRRLMFRLATSQLVTKQIQRFAYNIVATKKKLLHNTLVLSNAYIAYT